MSIVHPGDSAARAAPDPAAGDRQTQADRPIAFGIRARMLAAVGAACVTVLALTGTVIAVQLDAIETAARLEARNLAASVAYSATFNSNALQAYVEGLDDLYKRDLFIVDRERRTMADILKSELGEIYREDRGGEVEATMRDGVPRGFVEISAQHPNGAKQMVVPMRDAPRPDARIVGAVVLEYTDIALQLFEAEVGTLYLVGAAGLAACLGIGVFGFRVSGRITRGVRELHQAVRGFSRGTPAPALMPQDRDEIGELTLAFNTMAADLQRSYLELLLETEMAKEAARQVEILAYSDKLTGLANRTQYARLMTQALAEAARYGRRLALVVVDLDRFKNVNDTLGHEAGDALLRDMAARLTQCMRESDLIARLGGDEFVLLLPDVDQPERLGTVARKLLKALSSPLRLEGQELRVTASIGISVYPDDGTDEPTLMKHADIALYQAKEDGRNGFAFYSPALNRHSIERLAFESELQRAFDQGQLQLHYQPKVLAADGRIKGVEALLRWPHPDMGAVSPARFIPVAEETGLIVPLGRWVLEQACRQQVAWKREGVGDLVMAVNLSARQFSDENLFDDVAAIVAATGVDPASLELEITESMLMRDIERAMSLLAGFKRMGLRLAVDDFGTGYSSLANLKRFPIDTLKIDRAFVRDLEGSGEDQAIAQAIITMAKSLGLNVVAEGVETLPQVDFLRDRGCDELQGFYFSKAVPAGELAAMLGR
ncbi:putative bifunctional diguanylate cyclase/phosphodiesterase [Roseateles aquatilis]|nr:EAL domain-containing protein [Roseateles aquatilis]